LKLRKNNIIAFRILYLMSEENYYIKVAQELLADYKEALMPHRVSGNLLNSLTMNVIQDGSKFEIRLEGPEYGIFLENGTRPHFPPVDKILEWVRIKPVLPRADAKGKLPSQEQLAFLIARKISQVGTEGTHLFDKTIEEHNYVERLALAIAQELTKEFDEEHIKDLVAPKTKR
jgi:hypothetical protein